MTLTWVTVYAPLAFATGRTGRLFIEFALTLAGAVLVSGFVALTLTPMMCSTVLRHQAGHGRVYLFIEGLLNSLTDRYRNGWRVPCATALLCCCWAWLWRWAVWCCSRP